MAKRTVVESSLTAVADAIRERAGITEELTFPEGFSSAVKGIPDLLELRLMNVLTEYVNTNLTTYAGSSFAGWSSLKKLHLPNVTEGNGWSFQNCHNLTDVNFDSMRSFGEWAFHLCFALEKIYLPKLEYLHDSVFSNCLSLKTVILANPTRLVTLANTNAFSETPIASGEGYIYVPRALVDSYRTATNWSTFASQIRAIEDYPDITGG